MRGDSTSFSTVLVCDCGARFLGNSRDDAWWQLDAHARISDGCADQRPHRARR